MNRFRLLRLALLVVMTCAANALAVDTTYAQVGRPSVVVAKVERDQVAPKRTFVGTVMPFKRSVVGTAVDGRVVEMLVEEGDFVTRGAELTKLRTGTIELELAAAKAEFDLRDAEHQELENGSRPEEIARANAQLEAAKALERFTQARLKRTTELYRQGTATQEDYESALSAQQRAEQEFLAAQATYDLTFQGPRKEAVAQADARRRMQREEVNRIEDRIKKYTMRSPFDGYVTQKHTEEGAWVSSADPVATVIQLDPVEISLFVPEAYVQFVYADPAPEFTVPSLTDDKGQPLRFEHKQVGFAGVDADAATGAVQIPMKLSVVPQADLNSRAFPVKIRLANPKRDGRHVLRAGMLCKVELETGKREDHLLVPKDALVLDGARSWIYVADPGKESTTATVRRLLVAKGPADRSWIGVKPQGKLSAGDLVVSEGNERLREGQEVTVLREQPGRNE